jgi:hypothetical protein
LDCGGCDAAFPIFHWLSVPSLSQAIPTCPKLSQQFLRKKDCLNSMAALRAFACMPPFAQKKVKITKRTQIKIHNRLTINNENKTRLASFSKTNPFLRRAKVLAKEGQG